MSYYIYDSDGYVGDLCSNNGLNELQSAIGNKKPFDELWDDGSINISDDFLEAVSSLSDSDETVKNFKSIIKKCKDVAIITDGIFDSDEKSVDKSLTPDQKHLHWEAYAKKTARQEEVFKNVFNNVFTKQSQEISDYYSKNGQLPVLNDEQIAKKFEPAIELIYKSAFEDAV